MSKHKHNFKPVKMFGITTLQCSCGAYCNPEEKELLMEKVKELEGKIYVKQR